MLKHLIRYLVGHGRPVQGISEQRFVKTPRVGTDTDHAGCVLARKSTTGAHLVHGVNLLKAGSWTQGTRSLSVAEAGDKGASMLLGAKSMVIDFGEDVRQCVFGTDSSSAKSSMERRGAGRTRHQHCPMFWPQDRADSSEIARRNGKASTTPQTWIPKQ